MIRTLIITDCETTGLSPLTDRCIEVACIRYDLEHRTVTEQFSSLILGDDNAAEAINRIPSSALADAMHPISVWNMVENMVGRALSVGPAAFMAHRAEFDHGFYPEAFSASLPWICSKYDVEWPRSKLGDSCVNMALSHGVAVSSAHRALTDCTLIARTIDACFAMGHDVQAMLERAMVPKVRFVAVVSYDEREKAKAAGFAWDGARKQWHRRMIPAEASALPFAVKEAS